MRERDNSMTLIENIISVFFGQKCFMTVTLRCNIFIIMQYCYKKIAKRATFILNFNGIYVQIYLK